jgi:hypothetical protein
MLSVHLYNLTCLFTQTKMMTRILLTLLIVFSFSFIANAQFNKGDILLGGQLSYSENKTTSNYPTNSNSNNGNFQISIGKAIQSNAIFGLNLGYTPYSYTNDYIGNTNPIEYKSHLYSIGIFYRKYYPIGKEFYFFGEAAGSYTGGPDSGKDSLGNQVSSGTTSGGNLGLTPGISYKISKRFMLDLGLPNLFYANYSSHKSTAQSQTSTYSQFSISTSLSSTPLENLAIGFRLIL